jgi:hypothetical protein
VLFPNRTFAGVYAARDEPVRGADLQAPFVNAGMGIAAAAQRAGLGMAARFTRSGTAIAHAF